MNMVRVRIAVAVQPDGGYNAVGWKWRDSERIDEDVMAAARDILDQAGEACYWLEADLPIPAQQTFEASVSAEERVTETFADEMLRLSETVRTPKASTEEPNE